MSSEVKSQPAATAAHYVILDFKTSSFPSAVLREPTIEQVKRNTCRFAYLQGLPSRYVVGAHLPKRGYRNKWAVLGSKESLRSNPKGRAK